MNRTTATVLGLRAKLAECQRLVERLRNNITGLCHENARLEMQAFRLLRRASPMLSDQELAEYEKAFNVRPEANK